ncbi:leucyl aminopeptidase family protein [Paenibacillus profundus]|uniref:Probable cytosol aminopeptidase n=1 Tax=Paenibacillus profundus TaxID=1173085 RepID=A0ABS8YML6_9BACL|nr:leucyl aminopeptidase family protein [Paenibacillus profundus]MCE5173073.1 leucyl aminopeptidase family protein [Paenibacillus profundus]
MMFQISKGEAAQVVIYPVFHEAAEAPFQSIQLLGHMGDRGAVTWFYGRQSEQHLLFVGLGSREKFELEHLREAAGNAVRAVEQHKLPIVAVSLEDCEGIANMEQAVTAWVEGWLLGAYVFDKFKAEKTVRHVQTVCLDLNQQYSWKDAISQGEVRAAGIKFARNLGNEPANHLRPRTLADRVIERFAGSDVQVKCYEGEQLAAQQMCGLVGVGQGSANPPVMIEIRYCTDPSKELIALVGKGITFDTGGISLKRDNDISDRRIDMGGAAAVIGAVDIIRNSGVKVNLVAIIAAAENIPDGNALLPGDVLQFPNGVSVQVGNTDSEGRLVLADALIHAHKLGAKEVIDMATLTYSCASALGSKFAGILGHEHTVSTIRNLSKVTGEKVWELPLADEYEGYLKSDYADICNISRVGEAGAITAALFLRKFVHPSMKWAHIDMSALKEVSATNGYAAAGATGYGARTLAEFVVERSKSA